MSVEGRALEANLGTVSDAEWRSCHELLRGAVDDRELDHVWDPELDGSTLIGDDEVDEAPRG